MRQSVGDLLRELGIPHQVGGQHRHVRPGWIGVDCPWCGTSGKWHLGIPEGGRIAVCWLCGNHSLQSALQEITHRSARECSQLISRLDRVGRRPARSSPGQRSQAQVPKGLGPITGYYRQYLEGRGFEVEVLEDLWGIQATGPIGRLRWRVWIPIYQDGRLVSWTTRAIGDVEPKYLHAHPDQEAVPIKQTLYGEDYCRDAVIIVEGPLDVWRVGPGAVCTYGMGWSSQQLRRLEKYSLRVICYDSEPAAQKRAKRLDTALRHLGATIVAELEAKDPGEAGPDEIMALRRLAFGD